MRELRLRFNFVLMNEVKTLLIIHQDAGVAVVINLILIVNQLFIILNYPLIEGPYEFNSYMVVGIFF